MADTGALFYDNPTVFANYSERRQHNTSANDTLEQPIFWSLLPTLYQKDLLDLGCGDAAWAPILFKHNLKTYVGVDSSSRMLELARKNCQNIPAQLHQDYLELWESESECYDIVCSRLALHYIENIALLFQRIFAALRPGGEWIFSVEHPVITSHQVSMKQGANRQDWVVDRYFDQGERKINWLGAEVIKYHRTVENYFGTLQLTGFEVLALRESQPDPQYFKDKKLLERRSRVPLFLFFKARKP